MVRHILSDRCLSVMLVYCGQTVGWIKMPLGMEVGFGRGHTVFDGDPALTILAYICCGQTAVSIKMPLGTKVGLSSGDIVFDGDQSPPKKGHSIPPHFLAHVYCGQTAGRIKMR